MAFISGGICNLTVSLNGYDTYEWMSGRVIVVNH
jgi:hypothetical protein